MKRLRLSRRLAVLTVVILGVFGGAARAYFTAQGAGTASVSVGTLGPPSNVTASATAGAATVQITWNAPSTGISPQGYYVLRNTSGAKPAPACETNSALPRARTSCEDGAVPDGTYTYTVVAKYASWTAASTPSSAVTVLSDNTPPALTLTSPADGSATNSATPALSGAAGNATSDPSTVTVKIYNGTGSGRTDNQTLAVTRSGATWSTTPTPLAQGTYTVQATQTDKMGNTATSSANAFTVDTTPPAVTLTSPAGGSVTNSTMPTLSGAASTAAGDASTVTVRIYDGTGTGGDYQTRTATVAAGSWSTTATRLAQGTYTAQATQTDEAGNVATSTANTFTVDTTAPALTALQMFDVNADGKTDHVKATFSETLADPTATAPWKLTGIPSDGSLKSVSTSKAVAILALTPGTGAADTGAGSFTIELAASANGIRDAAGNPASFTARAPADLASPVLMVVSATNHAKGDAGLMQPEDTFVMTFSEALAPKSVPKRVSVTESRSRDSWTLAIPGLINSAPIDSSYVTGGSGSSPDTAVELRNTTITATVDKITETTKGALAEGDGSGQIVPADTLTDLAGNAAAPSPQSTGPRLF